MLISSTRNLSRASQRLPKDVDRELEHEVRRKLDSFERSSSVRKFAWLGAAAAAGAYAGHLASPFLETLPHKPFVLPALGLAVGAVGGVAAYSYHHPLSLPSNPHNAKTALLYELTGGLTGATVALGVAAVGFTTSSPWLGAAAALPIGYAAHLATDSLLTSRMATRVFQKKYVTPGPEVPVRNLFDSHTTARPQQEPVTRWLDHSWQQKASPSGPLVSLQLHTLQNFAEESFQGVISEVKLQGADPVDEDNEKEKNLSLAFGPDHWRHLEKRLSSQAKDYPGTVTRSLYSNLEKLDKPGGREEILNELGFESKSQREIKGVTYTLFQPSGAQATDPAVLNLTREKSGDATLFYSRRDEAEKILKESTGDGLLTELAQVARAGVNPRATENEIAVVGFGPNDFAIAMPQSTAHKASFRVHAAALLDKALRDTIEASERG